MTFWYLSFADPDRPAGTRWLGAAIVKAQSAKAAVIISHMYKINPGGEVVIEEIENIPPERFLNRLLGRDDLREMGKIMGDTLAHDLTGRTFEL